MSSGPAAAVDVFCAYAHRDEPFLDELIEHLAPLRRLGRIDVWHDRRIDAGAEWEGAIDGRIQTFPVILLLISPSFVNSDYCYGKELAVAIRRHDRGEARVIPIVVRPCDWKVTPIAKLQALPRDARPVSRWEDRDDAWLDVVTGIRRVIETPDGDRPNGARTSDSVDAFDLETPISELPTAMEFSRDAAALDVGLRSRKACVVLESVHSKSTPEATTFTAFFRNEGEHTAFDVKVSYGTPAVPRERPAGIVCPRLDPVTAGEPQRRRSWPSQCSYSFAIPAPERDPSGEVRPGQERIAAVRVVFRDGLDEEDEATYVLRLSNDGPNWRAQEDRSRAVLSRLCRRVRPEARPSPTATRNAPVRFGAGADEPRLGADAEAVLLAAARVALRTGEVLMTTDDLGTEPGIPPREKSDVRHSVDALLRQELLAKVQDMGSLGLRVGLTTAGLTYALPIVVPNFDEYVERLRRVICDVTSTTDEELAHTGISRLVVEQVALDFKRQGFLRTRRYAEGTMKIDSPSPELCP